MSDKPQEPAAPEAPEWLPRPLAWFWKRYGPLGVLIVVVVAQMLGLTDELAAVAGVMWPQAGGDTAGEECRDLAILIAEIRGEFNSEALHAREVRSQILIATARGRGAPAADHGPPP